MNNEQLVSDLKAVRELLSNRKRWTKGWVARTSNGGMCESRSGDAVAWCLVGAVSKVTAYRGSYSKRRAERVDRALRRVIDPACKERLISWRLVAAFNDRTATTHEDVIRVLDKAIKEFS